MQTYIVLIACVILLLCLFFRVPVYISVFAAALTYFLFQTGSSPAIIAQRIGGGIQSIPLLAIPFFICAGIFMNSSGVIIADVAVNTEENSLEYPFSSISGTRIFASIAASARLLPERPPINVDKNINKNTNKNIKEEV